MSKKYITMTRFRAAALTLLGATLVTSAPAYADAYQDSSKLFKQGSHKQALDKINSYLSANPKDAKGRFLKGLILVEQKKNAEAIHIFSALTEDYPQLPEPYNNLAVLYAAQGDYEKARAALETAIRTHPSYATAHENLGDIYAKLASQAYDKALQLDRNNTSAQVKLALVKDLFPEKPAKSEKAEKMDNPDKPAVIAQAPAPVAAPKVASAPKPAPATPAKTSSPPAPPVAPPTKAVDESGAILQTVHGWAKAWSNKDVPGYLAFYATDFKVPGGASRADWEKSRRERILAPKTIQVSVIAPKIHLLDANRATASFRQGYRSDTLNTQAGKTLTLIKSGGRWLIQQEQVGRQ
ncbi:MAG: tetratricopeptide repeat protein [Pseudomonadota bacterium]